MSESPSPAPTCPICIGTRGSSIAAHPDLATRIIGCPDCGARFASWLPEAYLDGFYASTYRSARPSHELERYREFLAKRASAQLKTIGPLPDPVDVLDVGAGPAVLLRAVPGGGRRVAVEPDVGLAQAIADDDRLELATIDELVAQPASFDVIVMSHVLEHRPWPQDDLASAAALLRPGGKLFIEVPHETEQVFWQRSLTASSDAHLQFFDLESLRALLGTQTGFDSVEILTAGISTHQRLERHPLDSFADRADLDGVWLRALARRGDAPVGVAAPPPDPERRLLDALVELDDLRAAAAERDQVIDSLEREQAAVRDELTQQRAQLANATRRADDLERELRRWRERAERDGRALGEAREVRRAETRRADAAERSLAKVRGSRTYRLARALGAPVRKLRRLVRP